MPSSRGVDLFVFAGDAYKTRDPNPTYQREFARRIKRIADAGIPVILLVGNHDLPAVARRATSVDIFGTLDVPNVTVGNREEVVQVTCRRGQRLQVALAPYPQRSALVSRVDNQGKSLDELDALLRNAMIENLQGLAYQARQSPDVPAILVGHFSVNEASPGSERDIMVGRDAAIPRSALADPTWRYVALGHIHKHQSLNGDLQPPVIYSGSIERIDFSEEGHPKGFVVAEISDGPTTWEFIQGYKRFARPFVTIEVDLHGRADPTVAVVEAIQAQGDLSESVVKLKLKLRQEQEAALVEREISRALEGAYFVAPLQKDVERDVRIRIGQVSIEALTPAELLAEYLKVKEIPAERAKLLQEHGDALIGAADGARLDVPGTSKSPGT